GSTRRPLLSRTLRGHFVLHDLGGGPLGWCLEARHDHRASVLLLFEVAAELNVRSGLADEPRVGGQVDMRVYSNRPRRHAGRRWDPEEDARAAVLGGVVVQRDGKSDQPASIRAGRDVRRLVELREVARAAVDVSLVYDERPVAGR